jgi:adenosylhomocysteinase
VIDERHLANMKDGAILANTGHFNVEINIPVIEKLAKSKRRVKPFIEEYTMADGRRIYLLAEGRLINLSAAEGHPASVMDMSFANQALSVEYVVKNKGKLAAKVHMVPDDIDREVGRLKLQAMNVKIDVLTEEQKKYLASWESGT